jgi:hypothetical protein
MYAHVTIGHVEPSQLDKFLDTCRMTNIPGVKGQPGFESALVLADPESGKFIGIAFFQNAADRQAVEDSGFAARQRSQTGSLLDLTLNEPEFYEVRIADGDIREVERSASS